MNKELEFTVINSSILKSTCQENEGYHLAELLRDPVVLFLIQCPIYFTFIILDE